MFLPDEETMKYVRSLTKDPSDQNIQTVITEIRGLLPDDDSVDSQVELIAMAVEPVHKGITERLRKGL